MAAREFHGRIFNDWDTALFRVADDCDSGEWQEPFLPSKIPGAGKIEPQSWGEWRSESDGIMTGTSGWARWAVRVLEISEGVEHFEYVQVNWSIPFNQVFSDVHITCSVSRNNPSEGDEFARPDPRLPILELVPWSKTKDGELALPTGEEPGQSTVIAQGGDLIANFPAAFLSNFSLSQRPVVPFTLRRRKVDQAQTGVQVAEPVKGIIYAVTPRVEASAAIGIGPGMGGHRAAGGDLMWAHHIGRENGTFDWESDLKKVGTAWSGLKHIFSGGNGILYAITPHVEARLNVAGEMIPASGGDLLWYRHVGREDGSFSWEGPKLVGSGWGEFTHVFSGGEGIIYAITPTVEASLPIGIGPGMEGHPASGGDLMWARHLGSEDGSFEWEGDFKKVGKGWGDLTQVFSGGNGIIYAITPVVEGSVHITGGTTPASGGDLMWGRHLGREDGTFRWAGDLKKVGKGWGELKHVFSDSHGIIYAITPTVESSLPIGIGPGMGGHSASGGDLMWAHHLGNQDGTFKWASELKKVGAGWGEMLHVFSGD